MGLVMSTAARTVKPKARGEPNPGDSNITEMVRHGVVKARERLIDLGLRNGMLNYRHSETSSRHVRIVNEQPSLLVGALESGRSLDIVPVPPVELVPRD